MRAGGEGGRVVLHLQSKGYVLSWTGGHVEPMRGAIGSVWPPCFSRVSHWQVCAWYGS